MVIALIVFMAACTSGNGQKDIKTDSVTELNVDTVNGTVVDSLGVDSVKH